MRQGLAKTAIWAVAVVCVALIMATGDVQAPPQTKVTEVAGTVDVGNLPLDEAGALMVSHDQSSPPLYAFIKLPGPIHVPFESSVFATALPISVAGWSKVHILARTTPTEFGRGSTVSLEFGGDDVFVPKNALTIRGSTSDIRDALSSFDVFGPEMQLEVFTDDDVFVEIWLYLTR